ncbi:MAG: argininosuccinate lyase [Bacteroidota bacterium]
MNNKIWQKEYLSSDEHAEMIEKFTVGNDKVFDLQLAKFDVIGSLAHVKMLETVGLLTSDEWKLIDKALRDILQEIKLGQFTIEDGVEDVHSQIEFLLTERIGEAGKKIHSARSRNDQVLLDIKLFLRHQITEIAQHTEQLFNALIGLSETHKKKYLPGYTHFQLAMPSSFGLWFAAYAESLIDDTEVLVSAFHVCNKNPLGSGAGYGSSFPIDRILTTQLMEFETMNYNVVYAQMSRGKTEKIVAMAMANIAATLSKFAYDICLYMNQNFAFVSFPDSLTTGSSIMPHKKNPDVFELIRAKCNRIQALPNELTLLTNNLPSGYHRDWQLTKECLFPAIDELLNCLKMAVFMLEHMEVQENILADDKYNLLYSVEEVNREVTNGVPFRDAYKNIASKIETGHYEPSKHISHTHEGSMGNLCNDKIVREFKTVVGKILKKPNL